MPKRVTQCLHFVQRLDVRDLAPAQLAAVPVELRDVAHGRQHNGERDGVAQSLRCPCCRDAEEAREQQRPASAAHCTQRQRMSLHIVQVMHMVAMHSSMVIAETPALLQN